MTLVERADLICQASYLLLLLGKRVEQQLLSCKSWAGLRCLRCQPLKKFTLSFLTGSRHGVLRLLEGNPWPMEGRTFSTATRAHVFSGNTHLGGSQPSL